MEHMSGALMEEIPWRISSDTFDDFLRNRLRTEELDFASYKAIMLVTLGDHWSGQVDEDGDRFDGQVYFYDLEKLENELKISPGLKWRVNCATELIDEGFAVCGEKNPFHVMPTVEGMEAAEAFLNMEDSAVVRPLQAESISLDDGYTAEENALLIEITKNEQRYWSDETDSRVNFSLASLNAGLDLPRDQLENTLSKFEIKGLTSDTEVLRESDCFAYLNPAAIERGQLLLHILNMQQDAESDIEIGIPASNRLVSLDHNMPELVSSKETIDNVLAAIDSINHVDNLAPELQFQFSQIRLGRESLNAPFVTQQQFEALVIGPLKFIAKSAAGGVIGTVAALAVVAIGKAILLSGALF